MNQLISYAKETWECVKSSIGVIVDEIIRRVKIIIRVTIIWVKSSYQRFRNTFSPQYST